MADARPCGVWRLDLAHAGRAADRASSRAHGRREAAADRAGARDRARSRQEGTLDRYLTLAPFGGNLEGVRAASLAYFGKEPLRLTVAEAALLVALPQSPEARRPDRSPKVARAARDRVLDRVAAHGLISAADAEAAKREPVPEARLAFPALAAHAAEEAVAADSRAKVIKLSIDARLQAKLETSGERQRRAARPETVGGDRRRRQCDGRDSRPRGLSRL